MMTYTIINVILDDSVNPFKQSLNTCAEVSETIIYFYTLTCGVYCRCPCALACIFNVVVALGYGNTAGYSHFTFNKGLVLDQQLS